ncbi:unnamed protein product [Tilletia laevis]|uniref:Nucleotidyl transferase domain-containing protein n=2 Tax=Tilletia laevis TaxID=157183 RepID=A0A9N8LSG4_9BASI|nr:unnamed protein product [Tilletia laevis]
MLPSVLHDRDLYLRKPSQINTDNGTSTDGGILVRPCGLVRPTLAASCGPETCVHMGPSRRLLPLCGSSRLMVVTGSAHVGGVGAQLPELSEANLLAEPSPKESMAAIGLAAAVFKRRFGYIKLGEKLNLGAAPNARRVTEFKEKPDARTASAYLATGQYRWNGGMFVVQAKTLLSPTVHAGPLDKIAIDHAVAEPAAKAGRVAVVSATFGWDDVEDFASLADLLPSEKGEACILGDPRLVVTESQAGGLIVPAAVRPRASLGVDDVVIVDTPDALLVTTRARTLARGQEDRGLPRAGLLPRAAYACCLACLVRPTPAASPASCGPRLLPRAALACLVRSRIGVEVEVESDWSRIGVEVGLESKESKWSRIGVGP